MKNMYLYMYLLFMNIVDHIKPYIVRANTFIRTISGIFSRTYSQQNITDTSSTTVVVGYMEHDPKSAARKARKIHSKLF